MVVLWVPHSFQEWGTDVCAHGCPMPSGRGGLTYVTSRGPDIPMVSRSFQAWGTDIYVEPLSVPRPDTGWRTRPVNPALRGRIEVSRPFQGRGTEHVRHGWSYFNRGRTIPIHLNG